MANSGSLISPLNHFLPYWCSSPAGVSKSQPGVFPLGATVLDGVPEGAVFPRGEKVDFVHQRGADPGAVVASAHRRDAVGVAGAVPLANNFIEELEAG
jgi:hypothetical protein